MPSTHPITQVQTAWHWLTTTKKKKKKQSEIHHAPIQPDSKEKDIDKPNNIKRTTTSWYQPDNDDDAGLAKPERAVHRLQELKSPPALPPPTGCGGQGFKSRPLYRRTRSSPAEMVGDGGGGADVEGEVGDGSSERRGGCGDVGGGGRVDCNRVSSKLEARKA